MNHENKCANVHGHNYVALIYAAPKTDLDGVGRVVDFSVLKEKVGGWIEDNWDHTFIACEKDAELLEFLHKFHPQNKVPFVMETNPTAENMAHYLLYNVCPEVLKGYDIKVVKVELWETENCKVEVSVFHDQPLH